jgi:DDE superfamily endonuclease/Helix-turn-helix of DDE superfamily endonuclease
MFAYESLARRPGAFRSLTGMTPAEFEPLLTAFREAQDRLRRGRRTTRRGRPRRRAAGAGHPCRHDDRHRLLMALVWLRVYPTYELLGFFFGLHKRNAQLNVRAVLEVLGTLDGFPFDRPGPDRKPLRSAAEVMTAFPQVRVIIDGKEQRVNRPTGYEAQKPYYSGKKKAHTVKTQVVVDPCGRIEAVGDSVPGGANHDLPLLCGSGVLERLAPGEAAMVDKGYVGLKNYYPDVPVVIPFKASRGHPLTEEQEAFNRKVARCRIVVEHTMAQLNRFTVLRQVFRGRQRSRHGQVIRVVARLVNRRLRVKPLKTYAA